MDPQTDLEVVQSAIPFKIFTGILKATRSADGKMRLHGVASSTVRDRHGDTMTRTALDDMHAAANRNLTIFLNHSYNVPEDVAGSVEKADIFERGTDDVGSPIWDLDFDVIVNQSNERAIKAFEAIEDGTLLGLSIGAMIPDGGAMRNKKTGAYTFNHVELLETSIVGIPANPRSWVTNAVKALKSQTTTTMLGTPTLTLDGDRYRIEGSLDGTALSVSQSGVSAIRLGEDEIDQSGDPDEDADVGTPDPTETTGTDADPDVQDAKVQIITIDTDDPASGDTGGSQGASGSDPDTDPDDDVYDSTSTDVSLAATLGYSLDTLETTVAELVDTRRQLDDAIEGRDAARRERDEVGEAALALFSKTSQIIEQLANMPVGRKAVIREVKDSMSGLERIYGTEILKLIRSNEKNG